MQSFGYPILPLSDWKLCEPNHLVLYFEIDILQSGDRGTIVLQTSQRQRRTNGQWGKLKPLKLKGSGVTVRTVRGDVVSNLALPALGQVREGYIYSAWAHMHLLGQSFKMELVRSNGERQCLLRIPSWDFHWQSAYQFTRPIRASVGVL